MVAPKIFNTTHKTQYITDSSNDSLEYCCFVEIKTHREQKKPYPWGFFA